MCVFFPPFKVREQQTLMKRKVQIGRIVQAHNSYPKFEVQVYNQP